MTKEPNKRNEFFFIANNNMIDNWGMGVTMVICERFINFNYEFISGWLE